MSGFKRANRLPIIEDRGLRRQKGASLIAAIFVMTALLAIGTAMTQLMVLGSEESINEWYSAQALYAAESGAEWSIYNGGVAGANQVVVSGRSWFSVTLTATNFAGGNTLFTITSTGLAGESLANIRTRRRILIQYMQ